jgi:hypothetical protein
MICNVTYTVEYPYADSCDLSGNLVGEPSASASTPALSGLKVGREAELFS